METIKENSKGPFSAHQIHCSPLFLFPTSGWSPGPPAAPRLTFRSVMTLFLVPTMQPLSMTKSLFTSP